MDLKQMRYFLALAQERNFGRAAQRLHMAQPPLTRSIQALEDRLGVSLLTRTKQGTELTPAGNVLMEGIPKILQLVRQLEEQTKLAGEGRIGRIDVGMFSSGILNVIPQLLADFHAQRPAVQIGLHSMSKSEQLAALREKRIDIGFNRFLPQDEDIAVEPVLRESFLVALHESHPLCEQDTICIRDLDDQPMIVYPNLSMHGLAQEVAQAFREEDSKLRIEQGVEDVVTSIALVASGFGLCITTESAANLHLPGVVYRPLNSARLRDIELSCLYRRDNASPVLQAFLEVVRRFAPKYQPTQPPQPAAAPGD
jgi:DNA-binding transcriptional LysR family regulator